MNDILYEFKYLYDSLTFGGTAVEMTQKNLLNRFFNAVPIVQTFGFFFSSKVFPKLAVAQDNGPVKIVNICSSFYYLCLTLKALGGGGVFHPPMWGFWLITSEVESFSTGNFAAFPNFKRRIRKK